MVRTIMIDWSFLDRKPLLTSNPRKHHKVKAFIQARMTSSRLPGKIYMNINGAPMLFHTIDTAKRCKLIDDVIVVSPHKLTELPDNIGEFIHYGPEEDVLGRYVEALKSNPCDYVVRLTSDCPLLDPYLIDFVIASSLGYDYGSNVLVPTFPDGMDTEVFSAAMLDYMDKNSRTKYEREHVTAIVRNTPQVQIEKNLVSVQCLLNQSSIKLSVDTQDDLDRVSHIAESLQRNLCR